MADEITPGTSPAPDAQPPAPAAPAPDAPQPSAAAETESATPPDPLSADERAALDAEKDPDKRILGYQRAYSRKLNEVHQQQEAARAWQPLVDAFQADPKATISHLASQLGLTVTDPQAQTTQKVVEDLGDSIMQTVRTSLGPEYEDLADRLAPAMRAVAEAVAKQATQPLQARTEELIQDSALRESQAVLDAFGKSHPDWQQHEKAMTALSQKLSPTGMTETEYLETLYFLATKDRVAGETAKASIQRMTKSATAASETPTVGADKVAQRPARPPTIREAFELAKQGIRLE